jgi:glucokinase
MPTRRVIGVDMGGTKLLAGVFDGELGVDHRVQRNVVGLDQITLLTTVQDAIDELRKNAAAEIAAVGFGIPSLIDSRTGESVISVHLQLANVPFGSIMAERLGLPVFVDNDSNLTALAEHRRGAAVGCDHVVVVTLGTGIGGGLILNGELYRGSTGAGAELGHVVIDVNGPPCHGNCPNRGCVEALASGTALTREARRIAAERPFSGLARAQSGGRELTGPLVTELAQGGDESAIEVVRLIGSRLGVALANYVNIFNPEVIVIGGGVIAAGELLLEPARREVSLRALPPSRDVVRIVAARFGIEAGMVGAAVLALDGLKGRGEEL